MRIVVTREGYNLVAICEKLMVKFNLSSSMWDVDVPRYITTEQVNSLVTMINMIHDQRETLKNENTNA